MKPGIFFFFLKVLWKMESKTGLPEEAQLGDVGMPSATLCAWVSRASREAGGGSLLLPGAGISPFQGH